MIIPDSPADIANRLRGIIIIPVNDGAGLLDGKDTFERRYGYQGELCERAAATIDSIVAGEIIPDGILAGLIEELMTPADPLNMGKTYVVPIRKRAAELLKSYL